jgi:hypothetical protein
MHRVRWATWVVAGLLWLAFVFNAVIGGGPSWQWWLGLLGAIAMTGIAVCEALFPHRLACPSLVMARTPLDIA